MKISFRKSVLEYLKACGPYLMIIFIVLYILSFGSDVTKSYWLSDWSTKVDKENETIKMRNTRLFVYAGLGFSQSNLV